MRWHVIAVCSIFALTQGQSLSAHPTPLNRLASLDSSHSALQQSSKPSKLNSPAPQKSQAESKQRQPSEPSSQDHTKGLETITQSTRKGANFEKGGRKDMQSSSDGDSMEEDTSQSNVLGQRSYPMNNEKQRDIGENRKDSQDNGSHENGAMSTPDQIELSSHHQQTYLEVNEKPLTKHILTQEVQEPEDEEQQSEDEMSPTTIGVIVVLSLLISIPIVKEMRNKGQIPKEASQVERRGLMIPSGPGVEQEA